MGNDFWLVVQWWAVLFLVGAIAFPLTKRLFHAWWDQGYFFAKAVGMAAVTYLVYVGGSFRILPFNTFTIWMAMAVVFVVGLIGRWGDRGSKGNKGRILQLLVEELLFFLALLFWAWVKGHEPAIHSLEKFMDFGFAKSVLNSVYFPAPDLWYSGGSINYYYFGHVVLAVLTKLSGLDLAYTFNLMLATIFALTLTMSFSIGVGVIGEIRGIRVRTKILAGALTAFLVTLAGNLQTVYAFTKGYVGDPAGGPPPFWKLFWGIGEIGEIGRGLTAYWYANATRFIPFTIHEFPSYSFVVSDVHGHVLSLPFVLLAIALLIGGIGEIRGIREIGKLFFYGFLVGVLLMTNALDGPIYLGLLLAILIWGDKGDKGSWGDKGKAMAVVAVAAALTSLPFLIHFKSFVSGIALNCPAAFLANTKIGPFLFEGVEKCQKSPFWMMLLLWGFFLYCGGWFLGRLGWLGRLGEKVPHIEKILLVFFIFSIGLIIFPEFFYFKDIYPNHFRSNTMFKLGYDAFILFSIVSGYTIVSELRTQNSMTKRIFFIFLIPLLFLVSIFPIFSVRSYFNSLKSYEGLYGLAWLARQYPDDWEAIRWLNNAKGSPVTPRAYGATMAGLPVIVEAEGDSYTDYARVSSFTGLPTIIGWPVHEWLWRGTYDVVAPRREDVRLIYESEDLEMTRQLLTRYGARYIMIGTLERTKYTKLQEWKFSRLGRVAFEQGKTTIYEVK